MSAIRVLAPNIWPFHALTHPLACLADGRSLIENSPAYESLCNYGIIHPVTA